jgi:geranylgeranyl pyrophosphate synthase
MSIHSPRSRYKTDKHQYTKQKGFCEDLDEGKYSLPLIHLVLSTPSDYLLRNILTQRRVNDGSSLAHTQAILDMMKKAGSLEFTADTLDLLHAKMEKSIGELEKKFGVENLELRLIVGMLGI